MKRQLNRRSSASDVGAFSNGRHTADLVMSTNPWPTRHTVLIVAPSYTRLAIPFEHLQKTISQGGPGSNARSAEDKPLFGMKTSDTIQLLPGVNGLQREFVRCFSFLPGKEEDCETPMTVGLRLQSSRTAGQSRPLGLLCVLYC